MSKTLTFGSKNPCPICGSHTWYTYYCKSFPYSIESNDTTRHTLNEYDFMMMVDQFDVSWTEWLEKQMCPQIDFFYYSIHECAECGTAFTC